LGIFLGSLIFAIVYANTNNRFKLKWTNLNKHINWILFHQW
jgi:hypothetical protein